MSVPPSPSLARLARLLRELDLDVGALAARAAECGDLLALGDQRPLSRPELVLLAVNLHGWYTGLETLLERVASLYDREVPSGSTWHADLLAQMGTTVPGWRPALVPEAVLGDLHELRRFRHFFRNAYVLELDPTRVRAQAERLRRVAPEVSAGIASFRGHLDEVISRLAGDTGG